jgi:hypothetical protein
VGLDAAQAFAAQPGHGVGEVARNHVRWTLERQFNLLEPGNKNGRVMLRTPCESRVLIFVEIDSKDIALSHCERWRGGRIVGMTYDALCKEAQSTTPEAGAPPPNRVIGRCQQWPI